MLWFLYDCWPKLDTRHISCDQQQGTIDRTCLSSFAFASSSPARSGLDTGMQSAKTCDVRSLALRNQKIITRNTKFLNKTSINIFIQSLGFWLLRRCDGVVNVFDSNYSPLGDSETISNSFGSACSNHANVVLLFLFFGVFMHFWSSGRLSVKRKAAKVWGKWRGLAKGDVRIPYRNCLLCSRERIIYHGLQSILLDNEACCEFDPLLDSKRMTIASFRMLIRVRVSSNPSFARPSMLDMTVPPRCPILKRKKGKAIVMKSSDMVTSVDRLLQRLSRGSMSVFCQNHCSQTRRE